MIKKEEVLDTHEGRKQSTCYEIEGGTVIVNREFCSNGSTILQQLLSMLLDMMEVECN